MKKIITLCAALILTVSVFAQAPQKMSYQAVIRNASNVLVTSSPVGMQISILQGSASGTAVYVETQTLSTNANGLVSIEIGAGAVVSGAFSTIDWANGPYFVKTETDPTGGSTYTITGTNELMSVPYALHAKNTDSWTVNADTTYTMKSVGIGTATPHITEKLTILNASANDNVSIRSSVGHSSLILGSADNFDSYLLLRKGQGNSVGWSIFRKGTNNDKLIFRRGETPNVNEFFAIDTIGNVGIGTASLSPINKLTVAGTGYETRLLIKADTNASLVFTVGATKNAKIYQNGTRLFFGADGVSNIGSIDLNAPGNSFAIDAIGMMGIGTNVPSSKLTIVGGDVNVTDIGTGIILKSPNGSCWRITVGNTGTLVSTSIVCP